MSARLILDEHYSDQIAARLRDGGYDVIALVADAGLRALPDDEVFAHAATIGRRIVTENVKDFRPLLHRAYDSGEATAQLLLVAPGRFPRGPGRRTTAIVTALSAWLDAADVGNRPDEDWLI